MNKEIIRQVVTQITEKYHESEVIDMINDKKKGYVELYEVEKYDSIEDAYSFLGLVAAESDVIMHLISETGKKLEQDEFIIVSDTLCEIWGLPLII